MHSLVLENVRRHIQLTDKEVEYFTSLLKPKVVKRKHFLLEPGEICKVTNFVNKGCLRTYALDANGLEHNLMFATENWWISDMCSFLTQSAASYYIEAIEPTEVLQINYADMEQLYLDVPKFDRFFRLLLQNAYINQQKRVVQNLSYTAEQRYMAFREQYPSLEMRIPQKHLAAYLGITPVFLSMIRKKLSMKGNLLK